MDSSDMESVASIWMVGNLHDEDLKDIVSKVTESEIEEKVVERMAEMLEYDLYGKVRELFGEKTYKALKVGSFMLMSDDPNKGMRLLLTKILARLVFKPLLDELEADRTMVKTLTDIKEMNNGKEGE